MIRWVTVPVLACVGLIGVLGHALGEDISATSRAALVALHDEHVRHSRTDVFLPASPQLLHYAAALQDEGRPRAARLTIATLFEDGAIAVTPEDRARLNVGAMVVLAQTYLADGDLPRAVLLGNLAMGSGRDALGPWADRLEALQRAIDLRAAETQSAASAIANWQAEGERILPALAEHQSVRTARFAKFITSIGADDPDALAAAAEAFHAIAEPDDALDALVRMITARRLLLGTDAGQDKRVEASRIWLERVLDVPTAYLAAIPVHEGVSQTVLETLVLASATFRQNAFSDAAFALQLGSKAADIARLIGDDHNAYFIEALEAEASSLAFSGARAQAIGAWQGICDHLASVLLERQVDSAERDAEITALLSLARLLSEEPGREGDAERAFLDALVAAERAGADRASIHADALTQYGDFLAAETRVEESLGLYRAAVQVLERTPDTAPEILVYGLNRLGLAEVSRGNRDDARRTFSRALVLARAGVDPADPIHVSILESLLGIVEAEGANARGALLAELDAARGAMVTGQSPQAMRYRAFADRLGQAFARFDGGDFDGAAEAAYAALDSARADSMPGWEKDARRVAAAIELNRDNFTVALEHSRSLDRLYDFGAETEALHERQSTLFTHLQAALALAADTAAENAADLREEAFAVAQRLNQARVGADVEQANLRRALQDRDIGPALRRLQDQEREREDVAAKLALNLANGAPVNAIRSALTDVDRRIAETRVGIGTRFPGYADQLEAGHAPLREIAASLKPDEAVIQYVTRRSGDVHIGYALTVTRSTFGVGHIYHEGDLGDLARRLRCEAARTDPNCSHNSFASDGRRGAFGAGAFSDTETDAPGTGFEYGVAHLAYQRLIDILPINIKAEGIRHLIIIPDATLVSMPFHLMVSAETPTALPPQDAPWLLRDVAITVAPSAASFAGLRRAAEPRAIVDGDDGPRFLGIGDPLIGRQTDGPMTFACSEPDGDPIRTGPLLVSTLPAILSRGGVADVASLRQLAALPDTECELRATAGHFGAPASSLLLHANAREAKVKAMSASGALRDYDVISFATHGLIAGEIGGLLAGLVLTPPDAPSEWDDGLLTAAEVAALNLDADFVILSACNTASGNRSDEEGLTGLAGAFFYAGARNLLVSHWPVYSDAATRLTTAMFAALGADPLVSKAEALRRSMLSILDDPSASARERHPSYWGPFMMVGEGGSSS